MPSNELVVQDASSTTISIKRHRNEGDRAMIQQKIAELRMKGYTFNAVADKVGLSEKQVRRHYKNFLLASCKKYQRRKQEIFGRTASQFEIAIEQANAQLEKAIEEGNQAKIFLWHKLRQECLRDQHRFLLKLNFDMNWTSPEMKSSDYASILLGRRI